MFRWFVAAFLLMLLSCASAETSNTEALWVTNHRYNGSFTSLSVQKETAERLFNGSFNGSFNGLLNEGLNEGLNGSFVNEVRSQKGFSNYYLNFVPLEKRDFLFGAVSKTIYSIDIKPLVSFSSSDVFARVNAPLNYFSYLAKLGVKIREIALKKTKFDVSRLELKALAHVESLSLYDDVTGFIPVPESSSMPFENTSHGLIEQVFSESVWQLSFKEKGFERPVVFSGFVEPRVAEQVLNSALFLDDTVFGLSWGHGKFSHLIQLGMLLDSGTVDKQWLGLMVRNDEWRHLFDRSMAGWSEVVLSSSHRTNTHWIKPVPGFSSPNALQESLVLHQFSAVVHQMASDSMQSCQYLKLFFGQNAKRVDECRLMLEAHADNLRSLESWVILDFIDDIQLMRELASGIPFFQKQLVGLIENTRQEREQGNDLKEVGEVLACKGEVGCFRQFVMLIGEVACMATFHNTVVEPFISLREKYYLQQGYLPIHRGNGYRVYLLPE
ncbi:hypothetical protein GZ77_18000 [Endozoicomonas montiporae]|uniref:Uncharacterized protein n=2 Tax=Endozoicomonas montiporae TaxID=1027273 RepID=A0A081N1V5_9GAMM|nr:hypothetical protein [Endozoicomonas montiporae]AMO58630.1 hypothetical protein EZMO1_4729 [Endozoicomonas montiporae CL-33]KEQ12428.1 hypothetical protein GZ77_18000 [Endozoicomonas montiporae]